MWLYIHSHISKCLFYIFLSHEILTVCQYTLCISTFISEVCFVHRLVYRTSGDKEANWNTAWEVWRGELATQPCWIPCARSSWSPQDYDCIVTHSLDCSIWCENNCIASECCYCDWSSIGIQSSCCVFGLEI